MQEQDCTDAQHAAKLVTLRGAGPREHGGEASEGRGRTQWDPSLFFGGDDA